MKKALAFLNKTAFDGRSFTRGRGAAETDPPQGHLGAPALHLALIALIGLLAYSNTFHVPFVFDDESSIVNNPVIKNLASFLSDGAGYRYNPRRFIGYLTIALNYRLGGMDVTGYHIVNLAIHIVNAWLIYIMVRLTLRTPFFQVSGFWFLVSSSTTRNQKPETRNLVPLLAALLFVAHPAQTQAVTYVVQRLASLATLFYLASLVFYIKARLALTRNEDRGSRVEELKAQNSKLKTYIWFSLSLVSAILAMRTKEIAATLPLVVILYEFSFFGASARKKLIFLAPILLTALIIPLGMLFAGRPPGEILSDVSEMARESRTISRSDYLLTQFSVIVTYLRLLVLPVNQNLDYDYPLYNSFFTPRVFFSFLLLCSILGVAVWLYNRSGRGTRDAGTQIPHAAFHTPYFEFRLIAFGILWFFVTLSVESSVIPISDVIYEHRLYLPSAGAFIALAAVAALALRKYSQRVMITAATVVVVILTAATWQRNLVWRDSLTLWRDTAAKSPGKCRPHYNLGKMLSARGFLDEAIEEYRTVVRMQPDCAEFHSNLGAACSRKGWVDRGIEEFRIALLIKPAYKKAHFNLGNAYRIKGMLEQAATEYQAALRLEPDCADTHNSLGALYRQMGLNDRALEELEAAARLEPDNQSFRDNLAMMRQLKESRE